MKRTLRKPLTINLRDQKCIGQIVAIIASRISIAEFCSRLEINHADFFGYITSKMFPSFGELVEILNMAELKCPVNREAIFHLYHLHTSLMAGGLCGYKLVKIKDRLPAIIHVNAVISCGE